MLSLLEYGFCRPEDPVDHPAATWRRGLIWFSKKDITSEVKIEKGSTISFFLYADEDGLGGEEVQLVKGPDQESKASAKTDAKESSTKSSENKSPAKNDAVATNEIKVGDNDTLFIL